MKNYTLNELKEFDGEIVSDETFDMFAEHEDVTMIEDCGSSGKYVDCKWYVVNFVDGTEISIYSK